MRSLRRLCSAGIGTGARGCAAPHLVASGRPEARARGAIDETGRDARPRALTLRLLLPQRNAPHARQPRRVLDVSRRMYGGAAWKTDLGARNVGVLGGACLTPKLPHSTYEC